jgi:hypothetical protein
VLFQKLRDDVHAADGFEHGLVLLDLFRHKPCVLEKIPKELRAPRRSGGE